jgi:hypothetical protein
MLGEEGVWCMTYQYTSTLLVTPDRTYFTDEELKDYTCHGRRGKPSLDEQRLSKIALLAFLFYPAPSLLHKPRSWADCVVAIDKGIRNTFCVYNYDCKTSSQSQSPEQYHGPTDEYP